MYIDTQKKKGRKMGFPAEKKQSYSGAEIISYIRSELSISETMLAGLLDVTTRSLDNWKSVSYPEEITGKAKRLKALYEFVTLAKQEKIESSELLSLITESVDPKDEQSRSPLFYIVEESESASLRDFSKLAIQKFAHRD